MMRSGWFGESYRHRLAKYGVRTGRSYFSKKDARMELLRSDVLRGPRTPPSIVPPSSSENSGLVDVGPQLEAFQAGRRVAAQEAAVSRLRARASALRAGAQQQRVQEERAAAGAVAAERARVAAREKTLFVNERGEVKTLRRVGTYDNFLDADAAGQRFGTYDVQVLPGDEERYVLYADFGEGGL